VDFNMRGWAKSFEPLSKIQNAQAKALFDSALRLDPDNVDAMIGKARCLANDVNYRWSVSPFEDNKEATNLIDRALSKWPGSANAHLVKGSILPIGYPVGHPEEALAEYDAALEIDPNFPTAYSAKGVALMGRAREALSPVQLALRISPRDPYAYFWHGTLCEAHLHLQEYKDAIEECRRSVNMNNSYWIAYIQLISAYGATGQMEQARQTVAELDKIFPSSVSSKRYREICYDFSSNAQYRREVDDIVDGVRKAGIP
jgi:adenylate cyclase